ncbi:MAG: aldose epimerase family protein [Telluria sp.]
MEPTITQAAFGTLPDGRQATLFTLTNRTGMIVRITDFGGIITEIHAPGRDGKLADVTLGFDSVEPYVEDSPYFGALIGRCGNRIARGRFELDGQQYKLATNNGPNHLHGGVTGFSRVLWNASILEGDSRMGLTLTYESSDGEEGYPGNLAATVVYQLTDDNELLVKFHATTDRATPVNLTQHAYFNLAGQGDILGHELEIDADSYTPVDATLIPTGLFAPVAGTPFDFRTPRTIGERIGDKDEQLRYGGGYDHNFVLNKPIEKTSTLAARARDPVSGRVLELYTEEPGVQFYSGNFLDGTLTGKGWNYAYRGGFCLEPQHFPDSPNHPSFPAVVLRPGEEYSTASKFRFSIEV